MEQTRTLVELLAERGVLASPELERLFASVLEDMEDAHSRGTFHGDIKPRRITRTDDDKYKLFGYGAARASTALYLAPERARGAKPDARSDIYSLGAVLYEAVTGRPPFCGETGAEVLEAHATRPPDPPGKVRAGLAAEVEGVILRAMAKKPGERFGSAREFRAALTAAAAKSPVAAAAAPRAAEPRFEPVPAASPAGARAPRVGARPVPRPAYVPPVVRSEPRRTSAAAWLVPLLLVLAGGGAYLLFGRSLFRPGAPAVAGMTRAEAEAALDRAGLVMEVAGEVDDSLPAGRVASQSVAAGSAVTRGSTVVVRVSTGMVEVPALAGTAASEAMTRLRALSLRPDRTESKYSDRYASGTVLQT
ncbi:PASTA domain-containing protein, partial [candidate division WOR-3 bacterium]|nr:PASTA domain-containing protein [candidate division WOR-3 bacterium]